MSNHIYVNGQVRGGKIPVRARVEVNRQTSIVENTSEYLVSVESLKMKKIRLPLFDPNDGDSVVYFKNISTSTVTSEVVDYTPYDDSDGYIYDYTDVARAISGAFDSLCTSLGITDVPTMAFDPETNKFVINSVSAFRSAWQIGLNEDLFSYMPTFNYESILSEPYFLELAEDAETQYVATLELFSPVRTVGIQSNLPTFPELLPPVQDNGIGGSGDTRSILVDFDVTLASNQAVNLIKYSARDADHVWHNFKNSSNVRNFYLDFLWYDYNNVAHPIIMNKNSTVDIKMYFLKE